MEPPIGKFVVMYGLTHSPDCKSGLTYTPDYKSGGTGIIGLEIWRNWIRWTWGWETISGNAMNHLMWIIWWRDNHLRRDESFETWWITSLRCLYVCLLYLFCHRGIYSFTIEVYLHLSSKYIFFRHRSITPIAKAAHCHVLKLINPSLKKDIRVEGIASFSG